MCWSVRRGVGKCWESVLGSGGDEGKCEKVCWDVGVVGKCVGEVRRDIGVWKSVGKGVEKCFGMWRKMKGGVEKSGKVCWGGGRRGKV